eukprot:gene8120-8314_t
MQEQSDSEDDSWTPGQQQSNAEVAYEQEEMWDPNGRPAQYCANCTAPLYGLQCSDCGHSSELNSALFQCASPRPLCIDTAAPGQGPVIVWDDEMLLHEEGKAVPHPERPDRLRAIMGHLTGHGLTGHCVRVPARTATKQELLRVHTLDHLQRLQMFCSGTIPATNIPSDTYINQHTLHCAALAAGSAAEVAVQVVQGQSSRGAAIIRPPGHHAESNTAMGFCFFNNAAVAARAAQAAGAERVLILDWDVHHGNGTQHIFEADPSVLYMSLHRYDRGNFYPGTGAADEVGFGRGAGYTVNVPWDAGNIGDGDYLAAMQQVLLPIAREFAPNLIIISAGFDAADGDPIGGCCLTPSCFGSMTAELMDIAPSVLLLEGGYNLLSTAVSTEACLRVLLGEAPRQPSAPRPSPFGWLAIQAAKKAHSRYWSCLAGAFPQLHQHRPGQQLHRLMGYGSSSGEQVDGELELGDEYEEGEYVDEDEDEVDEQEVDNGGQGGLDAVEGAGGGLMLRHEGAGHQGAGWGGTRQSHTGSSSYAAAAAAVGSAAGRRGWQRGQSQQARQPEQQRKRRLHGKGDRMCVCIAQPDQLSLLVVTGVSGDLIRRRLLLDIAVP